MLHASWKQETGNRLSIYSNQVSLSNIEELYGRFK